MKYPENERILIVRPCLITICMGSHPGAKLLSALLYHARNCGEEDILFTIRSTQAELVEDMCGEMTEKTLHDTAAPCLQFLGYLDVDEASYRLGYTLHLDRIRQSLTLYKNTEQLEKLLNVVMWQQLEKLPIELEKVLINWKNFQMYLEKVLIVIRKSSNSKRGRKPKLQAASDSENANTEIKRDIRDSFTDTREYGGASESRTDAHAPETDTSSQQTP